MRRAVVQAQRPGSEVVVLYGDEVSFYRHPTLAHSDAPHGQAPVARCSASRHTRYRVCGAITVETGALTYLAHSKIRGVNRKRFLKPLRRTDPARTLMLIWDTWPPHQHPAVLATAAALDIHLLWRPTYAPWTNPIEKLWRWCKQDLLHHHRWTERWAGLRQRVRAWLDRFTRPSPDLLRYVGLVPTLT